jgi:hypothetical protein
VLCESLPTAWVLSLEHSREGLPISGACYAVALEIKVDVLLAVILIVRLHVSGSGYESLLPGYLLRSSILDKRREEGAILTDERWPQSILSFETFSGSIVAVSGHVRPSGF